MIPKHFKTKWISFLTVIYKWRLISKDLIGGYLNPQNNGHMALGFVILKVVYNVNNTLLNEI